MVFTPHIVPLHILPLYKVKHDKMITDYIITEVTEQTDCVNSIVGNIKDSADGSKKVRLCLDPKHLRNICCEHSYSRTFEEVIPLLHGKKDFLL